MKTASAIYKMLRAVDTSLYEWRVLQGENIYELDQLKSITISSALTTNSGIDIGNANSAECRMTLIEESANWQRMARFTIQFRISTPNGTTKSEWITLGIFYTDERSEDKAGNLSIIGFDAMLKLEQTWADKIPEQLLPSSFPITAKAWATMIQTAGLATFEDLTQLDDTVGFVGLNTTATIRDVLKSIAAVHAGNWMMTTTETLNLMQFVNTPDVDFPTTLNLNLDTQQFEDSPALDAVTGVHLETETGTVMQSGDASGYMVKAICDVSSTTGVSELCLSKIEDYVFRPFEADIAYLDPLADLGDPLKVDNTIYQIMSINWTLEKMPTANVSAPYDNEIDHEYTVPNQDTKTYRKAMSLVDEKMDDYVPWDEMSTAIEQNEQAVVIAASHTYVTQAVYNEQIAEIQSQLDGSIQTWSGNAVPTLNNAPAVDWITPTDKATHVGDTYFVNSDAGIPEAGNYYRFEVNNGVYSWQLLTDSVLTEALAQAAAALAAAEDAQDTADASLAAAQSKGRIFVVEPTPPYDVGDLWFNSVTSVIKVCMTARASGSFVDSDWEKRDKYTDDSALTSFISSYNATIADLRNQLDQKAETYYQGADPSIEWGVHPAGVAIAGIDVAGIPAALVQAHQGDLWYRTTDSTTWFFDGSEWVQQDVPEEVFDKIDGKAQIFVNEPYPPYNQGDLWFNSNTEDIMTCMVARSSGGFVQSDWQKRNKYTDDTATDQLREEVTAEFNVQSDAISAKVSKTGGNNSTFGWVLNDSAHIWFSGSQSVMSISYANGLVVKGNITATSGYIGNSSQGFEITSTAMRNGMTSLSDTSHNGIYLGTDGIALGQGKFKVTSAGVLTARSGYIGNGTNGFTIGDSNIRNGMNSLTDTTNNGVYIGTNGIALGAGKFKVTSAGAITATSGTIGGFTITASSLYNGMTSFSDTLHNGVYIGTNGIALGKGNFKVTSEGDLYANNGYFLGLVQASAIRSAYTDPDTPAFGYFNGGGLTEYSVSGGVGGQIGYTGNGGLIGANMEYSTISTSYTDNGINTSLGYANYSNGVFSGVTRANYVMASYVSAGDQLIVGGYDVVWQYSSTLGGYVLMRSSY